MINSSVGIRSLSVSFPSIIRTNNHWSENLPNSTVENKPRRARRSRPAELTSSTNGLDIWSQAVAPYLSDPFRGSHERRVLAPDESSLTLEYRAAKDALDGAKLSPDQVDLAIVASLFPEHIGPGSVTYLARQLELRCPAWNLESTCSSAIIALQNACALVRSKEYCNVLVVVSQIGSNSVDEQDTLSWSMGDGAGAFVVTSLPPNQGVLGSKIVPTTATCGAYSYELVTNAQGQPRICTRTGENANMLAETAVDCVRTCCEGAMAAAGVTKEEIKFFAFNTPTAWYARVCTQALGIDPERTINLYPRYANIGAVFPLANLYHAAQAGKIQENDLVLVYTNGAATTAAATVMRWGNVALGLAPTPPLSDPHEEESIPLTGTGSLLSETSSLSREKLLAAAAGEQRQMLETYLRECLANLLQLPPEQLKVPPFGFASCSSTETAKTALDSPEEVPAAALSKLDSQQSPALLLDSLMAIVLRYRIETDLQVRVPMEKFLGENTIAKLADLLLNQFALTNLIAPELLSVSDVNAGEERERLSL